MRCPKCGVQNPDEAIHCTGCATKLTRRPRRRATSDEAASSSASQYRTARTAYRLSIVSLVPFVGLILGPLSLVLGFITWKQNRTGPEPIGPAIAAMVFGSLSLLANWAGLILMLIGLNARS